MRAGRLDKVLTLQSRSLTGNDYGEQVASYSPLATVWGEKIDVRGSEKFAALQTIGQIDCKFRIRYRADLTTVNRVVCDSKSYDITGITEIGRREGLELLGTAGAD
jgi:SPP1 family predicted phage head-tail adaptor